MFLYKRIKLISIKEMDGSLKFEERSKENKENNPLYIQSIHYINFYQLSNLITLEHQKISQNL